jgi:hypothetical protein
MAGLVVAVVGFCGSVMPPQEDLSRQAYASVERGLEEALGWSVLSQDELMASAAYRVLEDRPPREVWYSLSSPQPSPRVAPLDPSGVLSCRGAALLDDAERDALMEELGVDMVVTTVVIMGARRHARALVSMRGYRIYDKRPSWRVWRQGPRAETPLSALELVMEELAPR